MAKLLYEDAIELMYRGEIGEEMYGPFGELALTNVVELSGPQPKDEQPDALAAVIPEQLPA